MFKGSDQILCALKNSYCRMLVDTSVLRVCRHFKKSDGLNVHGAKINNYNVSIYTNKG
jgi:hypothetical protein